MKVCVTSEQRFVRTPDGRIWTPAAFPYSFWLRYLNGIFDGVCVVARVSEAAEIPPSATRADGHGVTFGAIPDYLGPVQYLLRARSVRKAVRAAVGTGNALILRDGSPMAACLEGEFRKGRPFGLEAVTDPYCVFAPGSMSHTLRPVWRWWFTRRLRSLCKQASAVAYVTRGYLQARYPPGKTTYSTWYAAAELGEDAFASNPKRFDRISGPIRLVSIGSLAQRYKGIDTLIDAAAIAIARGQEIELTIVGDGKHRPELQQRATLRGIDKYVIFLGTIASGKAVRNHLDHADAFVLVSRTEGLPGAMIEAMARGLPCLGSTAGGIPELLPAEDLVPPGDAEALAAKLAELANDPRRMARMSAANLTRAQEYRDSVLNIRRKEFLDVLRNVTESWIGSRFSSQGRAA